MEFQEHLQAFRVPQEIAQNTLPDFDKGQKGGPRRLRFGEEKAHIHPRSFPRPDVSTEFSYSSYMRYVAAYHWSIISSKSQKLHVRNFLKQVVQRLVSSDTSPFQSHGTTPPGKSYTLLMKMETQQILDIQSVPGKTTE